MPVLRRDCPHCPTQSVAFELAWAGNVPGRTNQWNCLAFCGACRRPICFQASNKALNNSNPLNAAGDIEENFSVGATWPQKENLVAPAHTPPSIAKRYLEGEDAFGRGNWNSAVAMYRSALDVATKGMDGVPKGTFFDRLQWLHEHHQITPDIRSWADHVRVEGNAALHDADEFDGDDAKALRFFTEMFLRYVFELPGEVKAFREQAPAKV